MDDIDRAQANQAAHNRQALAEQQRAGQPGQGRLDCLDCGEPIPEARRKAQRGCIRCLECQTIYEEESAR